jgi:hypothetical protein
MNVKRNLQKSLWQTYQLIKTPLVQQDPKILRNSVYILKRDMTKLSGCGCVRENFASFCMQITEEEHGLGGFLTMKIPNHRFVWKFFYVNMKTLLMLEIYMKQLFHKQTQYTLYDGSVHGL